jgi:hypothetical protein
MVMPFGVSKRCSVSTRQIVEEYAAMIIFVHLFLAINNFVTALLMNTDYLSLDTPPLRSVEAALGITDPR